MSQRPFQPPAVMTSQDGVSQAISTPSRLAISVATSMSKPTYLSSLGTYFDCGGYAASVETVSTPLSQISASRSSAASVESQTLPEAAGCAAAPVAVRSSGVAAGDEEQAQDGQGREDEETAHVAPRSGRVNPWPESSPARSAARRLPAKRDETFICLPPGLLYPI